MHQQNNKKLGFTLIELMLAVAFVGVLLITVALVVIQIMGLYNKGLTLKEVDSVTRVLVRNIQQDIFQSSKFYLKYEKTDPVSGLPVINPATNEPEKAIATNFKEVASNSSADYYNNAAGGRLCTGAFSYVWNTGQALRANTNSLGDLTGNKYQDPDTGNEYYIQQLIKHDENTPEPIRFVKVYDPSKLLCALPSGQDMRSTRFGQIIDVDSDLSAGMHFINMFGEGNNNLMLYKFSISEPDFTQFGQDTDITAISSYYNISMVIGTSMGDERDQGLVSANEASCKAPSDSHLNDSEYCAINKVQFVARTGDIVRE